MRFHTLWNRVWIGFVRAWDSQPSLHIGVGLQRQLDGVHVAGCFRQLGQTVKRKAIGIDAGGSLQRPSLLAHGENPLPLLIAAIFLDKGKNMPGDIQPFRAAPQCGYRAREKVQMARNCDHMYLSF